MLSNTHSFRKLNLSSKKKRSRFDLSNRNMSLEDLALLVKRLSVQIDDLENNRKDDSNRTKTDSNTTLNQQEIPLPQPNLESRHPMEKKSPSPSVQIIIDPWASYVPQSYGALLQKIEEIECLQKCPNQCCSSTIRVSSADGVPWPRPIEPFQSTHSRVCQANKLDILDTQYTHWCTLMRSIPLMDPVASTCVKTIGLFAMRELLKQKAMHKREYNDHDCYHHTLSKQTTTISPSSSSSFFCSSSPSRLPTVIDPGKTIPTVKPKTIKDSLNSLSSPERPSGRQTSTPLHMVANEDMPSWMCTSETKTAIHELSLDDTQPPPPPVPPKEVIVTPTPSGRSSPLFSHTRLQKWIKYKKAQRKANTDTASTPITHSQSFIKKNKSWFF
ncbi:uncharacterized protein BX663DRAFT_514168 [Cokeromyces recurvatus]|uniref:uncharacterized protein n=1 Tax=Cokeromyces recurvatus TaxID=90255 RepID=UPI00221E5698|nr:uncharacterized protein BX663DRAFT_514168 [Cokeromyces recurvatus]KAI7901343.1 hypothetical protein BX663DRAFT_514168 [Cokeromyces recurvatus]